MKWYRSELKDFRCSNHGGIYDFGTTVVLYADQVSEPRLDVMLPVSCNVEERLYKKFVVRALHIPDSDPSFRLFDWLKKINNSARAVSINYSGAAKKLRVDKAG